MTRRWLAKWAGVALAAAIVVLTLQAYQDSDLVLSLAWLTLLCY